MDVRGEQLTARLQHAAARLAEWRRLAGERKAIDAELLRHRTSEARWRRQAERAAEELQALRSFAPGALLRRLTGRSLALQAAAEARIDEARTGQAACEATMEPLLRAHDELASKQAGAGGAAREYDEVLAAKEQWLRDRGHATVARLDEIRARLDVAAANRRAIAVAISHARDAATALQEAKAELWTVRKPGAAALLRGGAWGFVKYVGRGRQAAAALERAMGRVEALARAQQEVRALAVVDVESIEAAHTPFALGLGSQSAAAASQQDVLHLLERVRQTAWTLERSDAALHELEDRLAAERAACIEHAQ